MSLFGGDEPASSHEFGFENSLGEALSPPLPDIQRPPDARISQSHLPSSLTPDEFDEDSDEIESNFGLDPETSRLNRFRGAPTTWRRYTAADRSIAAALEQVQEADLAAHLYNAHALKQRARQPVEHIAGLKNWQNKDVWLKRERELRFTDISGEEQTQLVPHKSWTAWPLLPEDLVAWNETSTQEGFIRDNTMIFGDLKHQDAGLELREQVLAMFLRLAKERWDSRGPKADISGTMNSSPPSRVKSRPKGVKSKRLGSRSSVASSSQLSSDVGMHDNRTDEDHRATHNGSGKDCLHAAGKRLRKKSQLQPTMKPVILADDERAQRILQPSIHALLAQLDGIALAVRRNRVNHLGVGEHSNRSSSEFTSDVESIIAGAKALSRPGSRNTLREKANARPPSRTASVKARDALKTKSTSPKGQRPLRHDSDIVSNYGADYEEESDVFLDAPGVPSPRRQRNKSKGPASDDASSVSSLTNAVGGLMDWSEVLGLASMIGCNERVIARTAQRCAALFGESMSFRPFDESLAARSIADPVHYTPSTIPDSLALGIIQPARKRPFFESGTLRCPHKDCYGHHKEFERAFRVVEHVRRVHGYDPKENNSDNEERKVGGVHNDGFLQPISAKHGWSGRGRLKSGERRGPNEKGKGRKKQKIEKPDGEAGHVAEALGLDL